SRRDGACDDTGPEETSMTPRAITATTVRTSRIVQAHRSSSSRARGLLPLRPWTRPKSGNLPREVPARELHRLHAFVELVQYLGEFVVQHLAVTRNALKSLLHVALQ